MATGTRDAVLVMEPNIALLDLEITYERRERAVIMWASCPDGTVMGWWVNPEQRRKMVNLLEHHATKPKRGR